MSRLFKPAVFGYDLGFVGFHESLEILIMYLKAT